MNRIRSLISLLIISVYSPMSIKHAKLGRELFYKSREDIDKFQKKKLKQMILYSYNHTPYWKKTFEKIGLIKNNVVVWENLNKLPILTKDIIRENFDDLVSDECKKRHAYMNTSGGSTGEPVKFMQDKEYTQKNFGDKILFGILNGKNPGEKELKIWGSERDVFEGSIGFKEKIINWIYNRELLNSFVMSENDILKYINRINKTRPVQIWCYVDSIYEIARHINSTNMSVFCPMNIVTTAGVLYPEIRGEIQRAFPSSHILNQYGSREAGVIGVEYKENSGIRIFEHSVLVEILDKKNIVKHEGEGKILITNLTNYSMPLFRFDIGDMGKVKKQVQEYEGSFGVITDLSGRENAHFKKKDGTLIHGEFFTHLFYNKVWITNFKVIQKSYELIEFHIVKRDGYKVDENEIENMKKAVQTVMDECNIMVRYVDKIDKLKSGKYQFVISEI